MQDFARNRKEHCVLQAATLAASTANSLTASNDSRHGNTEISASVSQPNASAQRSMTTT